MLVKTLLNKVYPLKSFVYAENMQLEEKDDVLHLLVPIRERRNGVVLSSCCGCPSPLEGRLAERQYLFIPLWAIVVLFVYAPRRVRCSRCDSKVVERVEWCDTKSPITFAMRHFLAHWAKRLPWKEVGSIFGVSWHQVSAAVHYIVQYGLEKRDLSGILAIGIDEIMMRKGKFLTVVYQIDPVCRRLLWIGKGRDVRTLIRFFRFLGKERYQQIEVVCSDMWQAYLKVIRKKIPQALHILDRFHIVANLNKALNEVRAEEAKRLKGKGYEPVLTGTRYCFLKRPENLTEAQSYTLNEVVQYNLKTTRAYLLKEDFQQFWQYEKPAWAEKFLDSWCSRAMRSKIEPIKKQARSIRKHKQLILNWFRAKKQFNSGIVEGLNGSAKLTLRKARGFKSDEVMQIALFHQLGRLPEPPVRYRLW